MKHLILLTLLSSSLFAADEPLLKTDQDEISQVSHLIEATQEKLSKQKELKALMLIFQEQEEQFFLGDQSKTHAAKMVHSARQILEMIKAYHLEHLFSSEYMEELTLFSSIAGKTSPTRP